MHMKHIKHILVSALLSAFLWIVMIELDYRSGLSILRALDPVRILVRSVGMPIYAGATIPGIIAIVVGAYFGLWSFAKLRRPSYVYALLLGLLSFLLFLLMESAVAWIEISGYGYGRVGFAPFFIDFARYMWVYVIVGLIGGLIGIAVIRRVSPLFCPNCGNRLPPGSDPCSKCGTREF